MSFEPDADEDLFARLGAQQGVAAADRLGRTVAGHALGVLRLSAPDRVPVAEVGPLPGIGYDGEVPGLFHHREIDRDLGGGGERRGGETQEPEIRLRGLERGRDRAEAVRSMGSERRHEIGGLGEENAGIPQEAPAFEHVGGFRGIGLLDEAQDPARGLPRVRCGVEERPALDVSISGFGPVRGDAESHDPACSERGKPARDRATKTVGVGDRMVGGRDQQHGLGIARQHQQRRGEDRRGGIARCGFDQHRSRHDADPVELIEDDEAEIGAAHHHRRGEHPVLARPETQCRLLEQCQRPADLDELLGMRAP